MMGTWIMVKSILTGLLFGGGALYWFLHGPKLGSSDLRVGVVMGLALVSLFTTLLVTSRFTPVSKWVAAVGRSWSGFGELLLGSFVVCAAVGVGVSLIGGTFPGVTVIGMGTPPTWMPGPFAVTGTAFFVLVGCVLHMRYVQLFTDTFTGEIVSPISVSADPLRRIVGFVTFKVALYSFLAFTGALVSYVLCFALLHPLWLHLNSLGLVEGDLQPAWIVCGIYIWGVVKYNLAIVAQVWRRLSGLDNE